MSRNEEHRLEHMDELNMTPVPPIHSLFAPDRDNYVQRWNMMDKYARQYRYNYYTVIWHRASGRHSIHLYFADEDETHLMGVIDDDDFEHALKTARILREDVFTERDLDKRKSSDSLWT